MINPLTSNDPSQTPIEAPIPEEDPTHEGERNDEAESTTQMTDKDQQTPVDKGGSNMVKEDAPTGSTPNGNPQTSETV